MAIISTKILSGLQKLIGFSGVPKAGTIDLENISATLPIIPEIARRGEAFGLGHGWFVGLLRCIHGAAGSEEVFINPYEPGPAAVPPFPAELPTNFDIWLLGIHGTRFSGAGTLDGCLCSINRGPGLQAWGLDDLGVTQANNRPFYVARFDGLETGVPITNDEPMTTEAGLVYQPIGIRLPRGSDLQMQTEAAGAAATFDTYWLMGIFPAGLGQDVAS